MDKVLEAFRTCITEPKCKNCPWEECKKLKNRKVKIPVDLALAVNSLLVELIKYKEENEQPVAMTVCRQCELEYPAYTVTCTRCGAMNEERKNG